MKGEDEDEVDGKEAEGEGKGGEGEGKNGGAGGSRGERETSYGRKSNKNPCNPSYYNYLSYHNQPKLSIV